MFLLNKIHVSLNYLHCLTLLSQISATRLLICSIYEEQYENNLTVLNNGEYKRSPLSAFLNKLNICMSMCVCVCVRACVHAFVRVCLCVCMCSCKCYIMKTALNISPAKWGHGCSSELPRSVWGLDLFPALVPGLAWTFSGILIFLRYWVHSVTVDTLCSFLLVSVHFYFHDLQDVERYPFVFKSATSSSLFSFSFLSFFSNLTSPLYLSLSIVFPAALIPWHRSLFSPVLSSTHTPTVPSPLLSVSSSKWVFGCQCQSFGGGDESRLWQCR